MWSTKGPVTLIALFWGVVFVLHFDVFFEVIAAGEGFTAYVALIGFPANMKLYLN